MGSLAELLIKSIALVIYSDLNRSGQPSDVGVADGLGSLGTWHRLLTVLTKRPGDSFTSSTADLNNWLRKSRTTEPWFNQAQLAVAGMSAALGVPSDPAGLRSALNLIERFVRIRNADSHGGLSPGLPHALPPYLRALESFLVACPCFSWSWVSANRGAPESNESAGWYVITTSETTIHLIDLATFESQDGAWSFLNDFADDKGQAEFMDYVTSMKRSLPVPFKGQGYGLSARPSAKPKSTPLPVPVTPFVGRERDLEQAKKHLDSPEKRLITIHGFGGIGKTRFALQLATYIQTVQKKTHVSQVLLEAATPGEVLRTIVGQLGLPSGSAIDTLADALTEPWMIVLDNFEHVIEDAPAVVALLERCPSVRMLITSQVPLNVPGEVRIRLQGLSYPGSADIHLEEITAFDAVKLFIDRVRDSKPSFRATSANAAALVSICEQVGGSPLFLQLLAPYVAKRSTGEVADHLHILLGEAEGTGPSRQRTHRAMISLSSELLSESEKRMLRRLAYIPGPYPVSAAAMVCDLDNHGTRARSTIERLIDRGIADANDAGHVSLHASIKGFARLQLDQAGEANAVETRWMARLIDVLHWKPQGEGVGEVQDMLEMAYAYLLVRAACEEAASNPDHALKFATLAARTDIDLFDRPSDAVDRFDSIRPFFEKASPEPRARALEAAAEAEYRSSKDGWSNRILEAAEAIAGVDGYLFAIQYLDSWLQVEMAEEADFELADLRHDLLYSRVEFARAGVPTELATSLIAFAEEVADPVVGPEPEPDELERAREAVQEALDLFLQSGAAEDSADAAVFLEVLRFQLGESWVTAAPVADAGIVGGPSKVYSWTTVLENLNTRRAIEARARHPMDSAFIGPRIQDQIDNLRRRINPDGTFTSGPIRMKTDQPFWQIARRLGVLGGFLAGANDPVLSKISKSFATTRVKCERRLGPIRFSKAFDAGKQMTSMDVSRMLGPRLPGDGDHEFSV